MARSYGMLGPWEQYRKLGLWGCVLIICFLIYSISLPIGFGFFLGFIMAIKVWKGLAMTDPTLGAYVVNTRPWKIASYFETARQQLENSIRPVQLLGMGPPLPDIDHELEPGWRPMFRLSSLWSMLAALVLGAIEFPLSITHDPFWGFKPPAFMMYPLSVIGFYATFQLAMNIRRYAVDLSRQEPSPATMITRQWIFGAGKDPAKNAGAAAAVPFVLLMIVKFTFGLPFLPVLLVIFITSLSTFLVTVSKQLKAQWLVGWEERQAKREQWGNVLAFMRDKVPTWISEHSFPTDEEIAAELSDNPDMENPPRPLVTMATFAFAPNASLSDYIGIEDKVNGLIGTERSVVTPIGNVVDGKEQRGSVGNQGFRLYWAMPGEHVETTMLTDPNTNLRMLDFLCQSIVLPALMGFRGVGYCTYIGNRRLTAPDSKKALLEIRFRPEFGVSDLDLISKAPMLQQALNMEWVRIGRRMEFGGASEDVSIVLGPSPKSKDIKLGSTGAPSMIQRMLDHLDWQYVFSVCGLQSTTGAPPRLITRRPATEIVDKMNFQLPDGMVFGTIEWALDKIASTAGYAFIEAEPGDDSASRRKGVQRIEDESDQASRFTIIAAKQDPLKRVFTVEDYRSELFVGRKPGVAQIDWTAGIMADDSPAVYRWDDELPHLLIAGASGMGKSVIMNSMIAQLSYNNGPDELEIWAIEPKNEMQVWSNTDTFTRFVDSWTPSKDFMYNAANLMQDAQAEMDRRYDLMRQHPKFPKKLEKAREIAMREGPLPDGSKHPLDIPYMIVIVEECASLFSGPGTPDEKDDYNRLMGATLEIARKARAAGVYLVAATQYPTNASINSTIRNQMRRIGLGCQNRVASDVVIGQNGLEDIKTKGVGMMNAGGDKGYRKFRGFWLQDGDLDHGEKNDILDLLSVIPSTDRKRGEGGQAFDALMLPDPSTTIFNLWDQINGSKMEGIIDGTRKDESRGIESLIDI